VENTPMGSPKVTRRRHRSFRARETEWVDEVGTVGQLLDGLNIGTERVFIAGVLPFAGVTGARVWAAGDLPNGWTLSPRGHYFDGSAPTLRYERADGRSVEVLSGAPWFGEVTAEQGRDAWEVLALRVGKRFRGAVLLSTPASTGRDLFARSLGDRVFPVLSSDLQELIRSTSGQGRIEWFDGPSIRELVEYDGRMMYAGCARELGHGVPTFDHVDEYAGYTRGRYQVEVTVPAAWRHVGILGVTEGRDGWRWPAEPGEQFTTWCDSSELAVALDHGWHVRILSRLLFHEHRRRPLDNWIGGLLALDLGDDDRIRRAVRAMILFGIGAMHGRPHRVSRSSTRASDVPPNVRVSHDPVTGTYEWTEVGGVAWPEMSHPEWTAAVWGRARARLCVAPRGAAGMLTVPRSSVVACRTDAIYLDHDPHWHDTGAVGQFRHVRTWVEQSERPRPSDLASLQAVTGG